MIEEYLKEHFKYKPETGEIIRSDRKNSTGSTDKYGYLIIKIKGKQYKAHRIAWFLYYGEWPKQLIDHLDGNKINNKISNLRDVHNNVNVKNRHDTSGVYIDNTKGLKKRYATRHNKKMYRFLTLEEALAFKQEKRRENAKIR